MPVAQRMKHRRTTRCEKATEMRLRVRDVEMVDRCGDTKLCLYGREGDTLVEGLENFKYLGQTL